MDKAKAMIAEDSNRTFVVDVFDAGSNQKVVIKEDEPGNSRYCDEYLLLDGLRALHRAALVENRSSPVDVMGLIR